MDAADLIDFDELLARPEGLALSPTHPAERHPEHWSIGPAIRTRDSTLLEKTNAAALLDALKEDATIPREDWSVHTFDHWGFGWVEHLAFRARNPDGTPTAVCLFLAKWSAALSDYPCADDAAYSEAQYEAALENIEDEGRALVFDGADGEWPARVWRWLWDNDQTALEDADGSGPYPSREAISKALGALGLAAPEDA